MARWNAYYESSVNDDQYPPLSTTVSAGASHFNSGVIDDEFGHAVANISGAFAVSQPRGMMMQPGFNEQFESYYTGSDTYTGSGEEVTSICMCVTCMCTCMCVHAVCACVCVCMCVRVRVCACMMYV